MTDLLKSLQLIDKFEYFSVGDKILIELTVLDTRS